MQKGHQWPRKTGGEKGVSCSWSWSWILGKEEMRGLTDHEEEFVGGFELVEAGDGILGLLGLNHRDDGDGDVVIAVAARYVFW